MFNKLKVCHLEPKGYKEYRIYQCCVIVILSSTLRSSDLVAQTRTRADVTWRRRISEILRCLRMTLRSELRNSGTKYVLLFMFNIMKKQARLTLWLLVIVFAVLVSGWLVW